MQYMVITIKLHIYTKDFFFVIIIKNRKVEKFEPNTYNREIVYNTRTKETEKVV